MKFLRLNSIFLLVLLLLGSSTTYGQRSLRKANDYFERLAYSDAIPLYETYLFKKDDQQAMIRLADCYRMINDHSAAAKWYGEASKGEQLPTEAKLHYGMMLQSTGRCDLAMPVFEAFAAEMPMDSRGVSLVRACDNINVFYTSQQQYVIEHPEELNTAESDFGPAFYNDGIVFASSRGSGGLAKREHSWSGGAFLDLYFAKSVENAETSGARGGTTSAATSTTTSAATSAATAAEETSVTGSAESETPVSAPSSKRFKSVSRFNQKLNTKFHEGPLTFDSENKRVYFTRNNLVKGKKGRSANGTIKLKVFEAEMRNEVNWNEAQELPFCSDEYSVAHPSLSKDGNWLYFASDMPGSLGGSDIWRVERTSSGWGTPENLGPLVNTEGEDAFPFIHDDGTLYFASDGHPGLGGLDIYAANGKDFANIKNMGYPLNTVSDDFGLIWDAERENAFFASNRTGTLGSDDIFTMKKKFAMIEVVVLEEETREPVEGANVLMMARDFDLDVLTNAEGLVKQEVMPLTAFNLSADAKGYGSRSTSVTTAESGTSKVELLLSKFQFFTGKAVDSEGKPIVATMKLVDENGYVVETLTTDSVGGFSFDGVPAGEYTIEMASYGFDPSVMKATEGGVVFTKEVPSTADDAGYTADDCSFPWIYFDYGKHEIRIDAQTSLQRVVEIMQSDSTLNIRLSGHTDSRSSSGFNERLAKRRANSTAEWLISNGIAAGRISVEHEGERRLTNDCGNGVECPEEKHQLNRRTEIHCLR